VDLHLIPGAVATSEERDAIDAVVNAAHPAPAPGTAAPGTRHLLLPALHAAHARVGSISEGALNHVSERLSVPPAEAYGVASFYSMFSMKPRPPTVVHVCDDIACRCKGAEQLAQALKTFFRPVAPTVQVFPSGTPPKPPEDLAPPAGAADLKVVSWRHYGIGQVTQPVPVDGQRSPDQPFVVERLVAFGELAVLDRQRDVQVRRV